MPVDPRCSGTSVREHSADSWAYADLAVAYIRFLARALGRGAAFVYPLEVLVPDGGDARVRVPGHCRTRRVPHRDRGDDRLDRPDAPDANAHRRRARLGLLPGGPVRERVLVHRGSASHPVWGGGVRLRLAA